MNYYDMVIVGAGPTGLALAHCCSQIKKRILVIDQEQVIGGCHRVKRVHNGMFTEHGPRIYLSTYVNMFHLMNEMNLKQDDIFTPYYYSFLNLGWNRILPYLSFNEIMVLFKQYLIYIFNSNYAMNTNLRTFLIENMFSDQAIEMIDRLCKFCDGAGIEKYSLNKLIKIADAGFSTILQPKAPLDKSLFDKWQKYLEHNGVSFLLGNKVSNIYYNKGLNRIEYIIINNTKIYCDKIILAIPPKNIVDFISKFEIQNSFGKFDNVLAWSDKTAYIEYISITYHFKKNLHLPKIQGFAMQSEWGIGIINLSDYMQNIEDNFQNVLSVAITKPDSASNQMHKTANECTKEELFKEAFRQIKQYLYDLPDEYVAILNPNNYYDHKKKKWENIDVAYFNTIHTKYIPFQSEMIPNLYNAGTHNGCSYVSYTTMESAVSNGIVLSTKLYPELKPKYNLKRYMLLREYIILFLLFITIMYLLYLITKLSIYQ